MSIDVSFPVAGDGVVTPDVVKKYFSVVKNLVTMGKGLALLTPTQIDDQVVAAVDKGLTAIEPYLDQAWAYDLINTVISLFKKNPAAAVEVVKQFVANTKA